MATYKGRKMDIRMEIPTEYEDGKDDRNEGGNSDGDDEGIKLAHWMVQRLASMKTSLQSSSNQQVSYRHQLRFGDQRQTMDPYRQVTSEHVAFALSKSSFDNLAAPKRDSAPSTTPSDPVVVSSAPNSRLALQPKSSLLAKTEESCTYVASQGPYIDCW
jgi:hypothetical protein